MTSSSGSSSSASSAGQGAGADSRAGAEGRPGAGGRAGRGEESPYRAEGSDEPNTVGTLFIMILFLMALAGMWGIMYLMLLER